MARPKKIYCPECNRKLGTWDGKATIPQIIHCRKCWKEIVYYPANGVTKVNPIPERQSASGVTFR